MIPVVIQENSPRFLNFVAEESNEERKVNLDLLDEVREEARVSAEALKKGEPRPFGRGTKAQLQREAEAVPGGKFGDEESASARDRKQVVPQVDWPVQSSGDVGERRLSAGDLGRRGDPQNVQRHALKTLF